MQRALNAINNERPKHVPLTPGAWCFRGEISKTMSDAIKACAKSRVEIATVMSSLLGYEVTVNILDKYTSIKAAKHIPNMEFAIAFDAATESTALASLHAGKLGCRVLPGKESLLAELGRLQQMKGDIANQEKAIKKVLGEDK